jgi:tRNA dimethylallyltransferase
VALAHALDGEVVNADSMQLYRGLDVGTAKLTPHEREGVPHHVLDIWSVRDPASVAEYQTLARSAIDDILARGRTPLLVGGSGLYVRAVLDRLAFPGTDARLRAHFEAELALVGSVALHARLAGHDPAAAERILPSNGRRIVRALEVLELTGRPVAASLPDSDPWYDSVRIGVDVDPVRLDERIEARVDRMWEEGLVEEVRALVLDGLRDGLTASRALGYQQALAQIDGAATPPQARLSTVRATRRFIRRQRSWFARDPGVVWLDGEDPHLSVAAVSAVQVHGRGAR